MKLLIAVPTYDYMHFQFVECFTKLIRRLDEDGIDFEVLPAFINKDGTYTFANTNNGGSWKITDPKAEIEAINNMDKLCNHNLKRLCKMARAWKDKNSVDISGILIDILAYKFL